MCRSRTAAARIAGNPERHEYELYLAMGGAGAVQCRALRLQIASADTLVAQVVSYPPGGKSPSHHHARSAFIYAHVLSGAIRSQVDDQPAKAYQVGEGFYELPGSHHRISENASDRDPASLLAVVVVDSDDNPLVIPD
jgi:quercetin dioxygenase-like cupin family protein